MTVSAKFQCTILPSGSNLEINHCPPHTVTLTSIPLCDLAVVQSDNVTQLGSAKAGRHAIQGMMLCPATRKVTSTHIHFLCLGEELPLIYLMRRIDQHVRAPRCTSSAAPRMRPFTSASSWNLMRLLKQQMKPLISCPSE